MNLNDIDDKRLGDALVAALKNLPIDRIYAYPTDPEDDFYDEGQAGRVNIEGDVLPEELARHVKALLLAEPAQE